MSFLLDTHILLWALYRPAMLSRHWQESLMAPETRVYFSAVSIAEIAVKKVLKRPDFPYPPQRVYDLAVTAGFDELPLNSRHANELANLQPHHRDPFDRLLIAQARVESYRLITADKVLLSYSDLAVLVS